MADILKQLADGNLDVEIIKKHLSVGKLQVSLIPEWNPQGLIIFLLPV